MTGVVILYVGLRYRATHRKLNQNPSLCVLAERDVDRKDAIIQMLIKDQDDAEEQCQVAQRAHMVKTQSFVGLHRSKLRQLESEFERELKALKTEFNTER